MIGPGRGNTTNSNPVGYIYINGDANTDGSHRFAIDVDSGFAEIETRISGIWQPASLLTGPNSIWVGIRVGIAAAGHYIVTEDSNGHYHFHAHSNFDGETSTSDARIVDAYQFVEREVFQPDNSGVFSGTTMSFIAPITESVLVKKIYFQTDSTAATQPVLFEAWEGTDDTGVKIFKQTYPASEFPASIEIALTLDGYLQFDIGKNYFVKVTSTENFSLKTNAAISLPWIATDDVNFREDDMLQVRSYTSRNDGVYSFAAGVDWAIYQKKIYICNTSGTQTGDFASNIAKWDLPSSTATDYWTKLGSALTYNDGTRDIVLIDTDGFKIYDNAGVDRFFIGDTFSQLRGETDAVGSRVLVSDIFAALMYGTGHIKILDNAIEINDTNRTRIGIDSSKIRFTAAAGAGYLQMTDDTLLYEDGSKNRIRANGFYTAIYDEPTTGGGMLKLIQKELLFTESETNRININANGSGLASPDGTKELNVTDDGVLINGRSAKRTASFTGGLPDLNVARRVPFGDAGTTGLGPVMPYDGTVVKLTLSTRLNNTLTVTLRKNDIDTPDTISLSAEQTKVATVSTTFVAGDRLVLFKEGTTQADALIGTFFVEFDD